MYELQEGRNGVMDFMANGQSFLFAVLQIKVDHIKTLLQM